jgi:hypothetical protein
MNRAISSHPELTVNSPLIYLDAAASSPQKNFVAFAPTSSYVEKKEREENKNKVWYLLLAACPHHCPTKSGVAIEIQAPACAASFSSR